MASAFNFFQRGDVLQKPKKGILNLGPDQVGAHQAKFVLSGRRHLFGNGLTHGQAVWTDDALRSAQQAFDPVGMRLMFRIWAWKSQVMYAISEAPHPMGAAHLVRAPCSLQDRHVRSLRQWHLKKSSEIWRISVYWCFIQFQRKAQCLQPSNG